MTVIKDLLQAITNVCLGFKGPLTFWSFFIAAIVAVIWIVFRSDNFHKIWSSLIGQKLKGSQIYKIIKIILIGFFILSLLVIILVFISPLSLEYLETSHKIIDKVDESNKQVVDFLKEIKISGKESEEFLEGYDEALLLKEEKDYENAIKYFKRLQAEAKDSITKESIIGQTTNSYYLSGNHREGLEYICELYKKLPDYDYRYRYDIHAHVRKIALEEGVDVAENVVSKLKTKYKKKDLSYVWIAIPLAKIEYLKEGYTYFEENFFLSLRDEKYLNRILTRYPDDSFLDHAYYFLHEPKVVIDKYPNSLILDIAMLAYIRLAYGDEKIKYLKYYLENWPNSIRKEEIIQEIFDAYVSKGDMEGSLYFLENNPSVSTNDFVWSFCSFSDYDIEKILSIASNSKYKDLIYDGLETRYNCFDKGDMAIADGRFKDALKFYQKDEELLSKNSIDPFTSIVENKSRLNKILEHIAADNSESYLELGLYLRDEYNLSNNTLNSVNIFKSCIKKFPDTVEAEKSYYLMASIFRDLRNHESSYKLCKEFLERYPDSVLADDMIAEIIVYYLTITKEYKKAKPYLDLILEKYEHTNAADNAINWFAWYNLKNDNYLEALKYYTKLAQYLGTQRGRHAINTAYKLNTVIKYSKTRLEIEGLEFFTNYEGEEGAYITEIEKNSDAYMTGLQEGDIIKTINGIHVKNVVSYYYILRQINAEESVEISVLRGQSNKLKFKVPIKEISHYPVSYYKSSWQFEGLSDALVRKIKIEEFVIDYLEYNSKSHLSSIMILYSDKVKYYDMGTLNKSEIEQDKGKYFERWPVRINSISSDIHIQPLSGDKIKVSFEYDYFIKRGKIKKEGKVDCVLVLNDLHSRYRSYEILEENGRVI